MHNTIKLEDTFLKNQFIEKLYYSAFTIDRSLKSNLQKCFDEKHLTTWLKNSLPQKFPAMRQVLISERLLIIWRVSSL